MASTEKVAVMVEEAETVAVRVLAVLGLGVEPALGVAPAKGLAVLLRLPV